MTAPTLLHAYFDADEQYFYLKLDPVSEYAIHREERSESSVPEKYTFAFFLPLMDRAGVD